MFLFLYVTMLLLLFCCWLLRVEKGVGVGARTRSPSRGGREKERKPVPAVSYRFQQRKGLAGRCVRDRNKRGESRQSDCRVEIAFGEDRNHRQKVSSSRRGYVLKASRAEIQKRMTLPLANLDTFPMNKRQNPRKER